MADRETFQRSSDHPWFVIVVAVLLTKYVLRAGRRYMYRVLLHRSGVVCGELWLTRSLPAETFGVGVIFLVGEKDREVFSECVSVLGRHEYFEKLRDVKLDSEDLGNGCMGNEAVT